MIVPVLAGLGALACMSNPRRRKHRRVRSNPRQRNLSVDVERVGTIVVTIVRWRNANATAFINVTADGPDLGVKTWEAKSQGPSSGGYNKAVQAMENVIHKIGGYYISLGGEKLKALAEIAADALKKARGKTNPRRRAKKRRSSRRR